MRRVGGALLQGGVQALAACEAGTSTSQPARAVAVVAQARAYAKSGGPLPPMRPPYMESAPKAPKLQAVRRKQLERLLGNVKASLPPGAQASASGRGASMLGRGSAASSSGSSKPGGEQDSGWVTSLFKSYMPDSVRRWRGGKAPAAAGKASDASSSSAAGAKPEPKVVDAKQAEEDRREAEAMQKVDIDQYIQFVRNNRMTSPRPMPRAPRFKGDIDGHLLQWHQYLMHEAICGSLLPEEKKAWEEDAEAVARDRGTLQDIATRTGYNSPTIIRECVRAFARFKDSMNLLGRHKAGGGTVPNTFKETQALLARLKDQQLRQELREHVLVKQDRTNCPIKPHLALLGRRATCPNTQLRYYECCGARQQHRQQQQQVA